MRFVSVITSISLVIFSFRVHADSDLEARDAFKEGVAAFEAGRTEEALGRFERAYALRPSYKILFNIAQAQAELGRLSNAIRTFEKYLQDGSDDITPGRRAKVEAEIKRLRLMEESAAPPPPGPSKNDTSTPDAPVLNTEIDPRPRSGLLFDLAPWGAAGLGATTLTIGIVLAAKTASLNRDLDEACNDGRCAPGYQNDIDSLKRRAIAADVMFVASSVFTAAAVSLFILRKKRRRTQ